MLKFQRLLPQKNIKLIYYLKSIIREFVPRSLLRSQLSPLLNSITDDNGEYIQNRLNYYNKLLDNAKLNKEAPELNSYRYPTKGSAYHFDFVEFGRYFNQSFKISLFKADITHVPKNPTIVKSRPINGANANSVLLNLNKVRHFVFVQDHIPYESKKDILIWRGSSGEDALNHRKKFLRMYFDHPMCNVANANPPPYIDQHTKAKIPISKHLEYKFILCIEGIDVATNLKWVLSSNLFSSDAKTKI